MEDNADRKRPETTVDDLIAQAREMVAGKPSPSELSASIKVTEPEPGPMGKLFNFLVKTRRGNLVSVTTIAALAFYNSPETMFMSEGPLGMHKGDYLSARGHKCLGGTGIFRWSDYDSWVEFDCYYHKKVRERVALTDLIELRITCFHSDKWSD